jgi:hypothetical protein
VNSKALSGIVLIVVGAGALWLWYRGYFNGVINVASSVLRGNGINLKFNVGGKTTTTTTDGSTLNGPNPGSGATQLHNTQHAGSN